MLRADWRSEQRKAVILSEWPNGIHIDALVDLLNTLPGAVVGRKSLESFIRNYKIHRSREALHNMLVERGRVKREERLANPPPPKPVLKVAPGRAVTYGHNSTPRIFQQSRPALPKIVIPKEPVILPPVGPDGKIEIELGPCMAWAAQNNIQGFDGSNVGALCQVMAARGLPPIVIVWPSHGAD
ncbi:MAG: hypothetical protein JWP29_1948 [Rhodoferax sp.]|nr:hypothetical protein [Rhodoferax sp.]